MSRRRALRLGVAATAGMALAAPALADSRLDFHRAVARGDARSVQRMLQAGQDPNDRAENGQVALFVALQVEAAEVAEVLMADPRTRIDQANEHGETPLMMAALRGQLDVVRRLAERGAAVRREGWTPLHYAASGPDPKVVQWLADRGAVIDAPAPNRNTPLMLAAAYGAIDSADLLLKLGADARLKNAAGQDAAAFAKRAGRDRLAERLEAAARR